jgi:hypothetical protein
MAVDPYSDGSGGWPAPVLSSGMNFKDYGSYGLRQYGGWVREEFLPQLVGREAARVYREMLDNSATVGAMVFAITQAMRKVEWRIETPNDSAAAKLEGEFADSLRGDMSHTWEDFVTEALSMLGYGYSVHELVYKRRLGPQPMKLEGSPDETPSSKFNDGRIGWRRLPIRGQDTVIKWFFDPNGQVRGVTQQPWVGSLIDIPIEKMLLFRPTQHKNNPEGRSVLRNAYRSYYFIKRLEELEAILFERMSGFPVMYVPNALMEKALSANPDAAAVQALAAYKKLVTNVRIDEQMGAILPSDTYRDAQGGVTNVRMYEFKLLTPENGKGSVDVSKTIDRHKIDMMMTLLCDFLTLGHETRGTNNLAVSKVDMFFAAIEGWLNSVAAVLNNYALPRIWQLNGLNPALMPRYVPDMAQRLDLDGLGAYIANLAAAGMPLFPDDELQGFLRDAAGLPDITDPKALAAATAAAHTGGQDTLKRMLFGAMAKEIRKRRAPVAAQPKKRTLYVSRKLKNADDVVSWAKAQGFTKTLLPDDMHVTIAFSRTPVDWNGAPDGFDFETVPPADQQRDGHRGIERLGDKGAVVLRFESPDLLKRWQQFRSVGASWDWSGYKPHVTITYEGADVDLTKVQPYRGKLEFGPERFAEVDEDWTDKVRER